MRNYIWQIFRKFMVPDFKIKSVKINSKKLEFRKIFYISRILTVENGVSAWAHNSLKIRQHFVRSLIDFSGDWCSDQCQ